MMASATSLYLNEAKNAKYNMIDALPACMEGNVCPYASPGGYDAIHPNAEERVVYTLRNVARLYPDEFRTSKWGSRQGGGVYPDKGTPAMQSKVYKRPSDNCGYQADNPTYWHTGANQVTRFHTWSSSVCPSGGPGHWTCPEWCYVFVAKGFEEANACGMKTRNVEMVTNLQYDCDWWEDGCDGANPGNEGLWWTGAYWSSEAHCGLVFNPDYTYHGFGFWPGQNSVTNIGVKFGPYMTHPLVTGMHMDRRDRLYRGNDDDPDLYVSFMVLFVGDRIGNDKVKKAYLLYETAAYPMALEVGTTQKGFYVVDVAPKAACAPYAFVVETTSGVTYRLPEDENYYFGTAWTPGVDQLECYENHYHKGALSTSVWRPNEADDITGNDDVDCVGCADCIDLNYIENAGPRYYGFPPQVQTELTGTNQYTNYQGECGSEGCWLDYADCVEIGGRVSSKISSSNGGFYRDAEQYYNKQPVYVNEAGYFLFFSYQQDAFGAGSYSWVASATVGGSPGSISPQPSDCSSEDVTSCSWGTECVLPAADCGDYTCLAISGGDSTINGNWMVSWPECSNSRSVYTRDGSGNGPYLCHNEAWNAWIVSNDVCVNSASSLVAQCNKKRHDPFMCTGDAWGSGSVSMSDCGNGAYEVEEALGEFAESVNFAKGDHNTRLWTEDAETDSVVTFDYYSEVGWSHDAPVYRFADNVTDAAYYLHFYDNGTAGTGRWMVSRNGYLYDESLDFAVAWCQSETLSECVAGEWTAVNESEAIVDVEWGNTTREIATSTRDVYIDTEMAVVIDESASNGDAGDADDIAVIVAVVLVLVAVVVCFVVGRKWMQRRAGPKGAVTFDDEQEIEVEAEQAQTEEMVQFEAVSPDETTTCQVNA